jgi:hypothetical protein
MSAQQAGWLQCCAEDGRRGMPASGMDACAVPEATLQAPCVHRAPHRDAADRAGIAPDGAAAPDSPRRMPRVQAPQKGAGRAPADARRWKSNVTSGALAKCARISNSNSNSNSIHRLSATHHRGPYPRGGKPMRQRSNPQFDMQLPRISKCESLLFTCQAHCYTAGAQRWFMQTRDKDK